MKLFIKGFHIKEGKPIIYLQSKIISGVTGLCINFSPIGLTTAALV